MGIKKVLTFTLLGITSLLVYFFYFGATQEERLIDQGNLIVEKIESYKLKQGRLPNSLNDIGIEEKMEGPLYYTRWDNVNYIVYFTKAGVGESMNYYSDTKKWSDVHRGFEPL